MGSMLAGESRHGRKRNMRGGLIGLVVFAVLALASPSLAAPGDLDPSFGSNGKVVTDFGGSYGGGYSVALQPDNKIVVAGSTGVTWNEHSVAITRYNPDGSFDQTFSGDGIQTTDVGVFGAGAGKVTIQPDGKIVIVGWGDGSGKIVRYTPSGDLDTSFSTDGIASVGFWLSDVLVQPDGKIVVGGGVPNNPDGYFAVARLTSSGDLDPTFADAGIQTVTFTGVWDRAEAIALTSDGKIVAGGGTESDWALVRLNPNGSLDTTFSGDGKHVTDFGGTYIDGSDQLSDVLVQPDGKIIGVGTRWSAPTSTLLARYSQDGSLDQGFGQDGVQTIAGSDQPSSAVALQPNGKIITVGESGDLTAFAITGFAVARFGVNGALDSGFFGTGFGTIPFAGYRANDIAVQDDGSIVIVGGHKNGSWGSDAEFGLVRLEGGEGPPDTIPPETTITSEPQGVVSTQTPTFEFTSSEPGSNFHCRVDNQAFAACSSPHTITPLSSGTHVFEVRAIDGSGNIDPTPASRSFTVRLPTTSAPPTPPKNPAGSKNPSRPDRTAPAVRVLDKRAKLTRGRRAANIRLVCPANEASPPCRGSVLLTTRARLRVGQPRRLLTLGRATFSLGAKETGTISLRLNPQRITLLLKGRRSAIADLTVRARDKAGNHSAQSIALRLVRR